MQIWLDVYDAVGNRLGEGPIQSISSVSIDRIMDGAGTITFSTPVSDTRALDLLQTRRRVRIFTNYAGQPREVARAIILKRDLTVSSSEKRFTFTCADALAELKDRNTLIGRKYKKAKLADVVNQLIALVPGWTAQVEAAQANRLLNSRFDGASILKSLQQIAHKKGLHLRVGVGNIVEVGAFGTLLDLVAMNTASVNDELYQNDKLVIISKLHAGENGEDMVNRVIPLGGGEGVTALTLKRSTRTSPYTIKKALGPNGKNYWYLEDEASIAQYGVSERVLLAKDVAPLSNVLDDKIEAANELYDLAAESLKRSAQPQRTYKVDVLNVRQSLRPGDKIRIVYKGRVYYDDVPAEFANIDAEFFILEVSETLSESGQQYRIEISNVDRMEETVEQSIMKTMEAVELQSLTPRTSTSRIQYVFDRLISPTRPAICPIEITDATLELLRVRVGIRTFPATNHRHPLGQFVGQVPAPQYPWRPTLFEDGVGNALMGTLPLAAQSGMIWTDYDIESSIGVPIYPQTVRVKVNGKDRTAALGGPFAVEFGKPIDVLFSINKMTKFIEEAEGGLQQTHKLEFTCAAYNGTIEVRVELFEVFQAIELDDF